MTRLRYNGLRATLNAALAAGDTTITFTAALTHSGGVAVPTLAAGDTILLAIMDAAGSGLSEIVTLTAYTSGATTGTISRAQQGTAAVAHSIGDKVVHGWTTADVAETRVPIGGGAGQVLVKKSGTDGDVGWAGMKFRGEWAGQSQLLYRQDFSTATSMPPEFSLSGDYGPGYTQVQMANAVGSSKPNYAYAGQFGPPNGENNLHLFLNFSSIPALAGKSITRVVSHHVHVPNSSGSSTCVFQVDGVTVQTLTNDQVWNTYDAQINAKSTLKWDEHFTNFGGDNVTIAGIELYGTDPSVLYATGEFVTYLGRLWKSVVDGNSSTPGSSSNWIEVPVGYDQALATASRPSGVGAGARIFDSTLGKPVWWNGTAWVDATGTAV